MAGQGHRGRSFRVTLAFKLAVALVVSTAAVFALFGYLTLRLERRQAEEMVLQSADRISDVIQRSTRYHMLRNDREALYHVVDTIGREPGIRRVRIFNEEGRISYSTHAAEVGSLVDKRAEACFACHAQAEPLTRLDRPDRARIFFDARGERVLGVIRPIENEPVCSNAACHAHPPERRVLGVLDTDLSLATVDAQLAQHQGQLSRFTVGAMALMSLVSVLFVWFVVHRPVKELTTGTQKVARGDLDHRLPVRTGDELGELAASFNRMTGEVAQARAELTAWARTLEQRVAEKTAELQRAQTMLITTEKMAALGKLAATVAHEVNNPLSGILTYTRLIQKELEQAPPESAPRRDVLEQLRIIERESRRCGEILRHLLAFARQMPSRREPTDLNGVLERALALTRHQRELQGIALERQVGTLPPVSCDANQMEQVVLALLVNAAEAMPRGGRLSVSTNYDAATDLARIRVRDTGSGIPPEALPHIFEPFFTTKENAHRTGLGLAVARSLVEQHGGSIGVESTPGQGTEFIIALPRQAPASDALTHAKGEAA
ncbi:MAG: HAMP domain-containing protein [Acidobacteria bacterium]|nr:HAMP domain-containing protein [Acidobacteriota bacterium]